MRRAFAFVLLLLLPVGMLAQTDKTTTTAAATTLESISLPAGIAVFGSFNQLGSPRFTGGFAGIYPVKSSLKLYGTTTATFYPKKAIDPGTGRSFYALSASARQGIHRDMLDTGRFSFLLGLDLGPAVAQSTTTTMDSAGKTSTTDTFTWSATGSFVFTTLYQINPTFSAIVPVRMLYMNGIGWNPVVEAGVVINLGRLPKGLGLAAAVRKIL